MGAAAEHGGADAQAYASWLDISPQGSVSPRGDLYPRWQMVRPLPWRQTRIESRSRGREVFPSGTGAVGERSNGPVIQIDGMEIKDWVQVGEDSVILICGLKDIKGAGMRNMH